MSPAEVKAIAGGYRQRANFEAWLHGLYTFTAVSTALANGLRKKGARATEYPGRPYNLFGDNDRLEAEEKRKRVIAYFNSFAKTPKKL